MAALTKAFIELYGELSLPVGTIPCMFNPSQYEINKQVTYNTLNALGSESGMKQFIKCNAATLNLTLFFDSLMLAAGNGTTQELAAEPVTKFTAQLVNATNIRGAFHAPPKASFIWGNLIFTGVITSLKQTFTMFDPFGKPIRAKIDLTIESTRSELSFRKASPFESPDRTKSRKVVEGMTLWSLAYQEYGDCEKWREIAKANHLLSPLDIHPGQLLKVPAL